MSSSKARGPASGAMTEKDRDKLLLQLQKRMVETGSWDRIARILKRDLDETGWSDDIKDRTKEECRKMPTLHLRTLEQSVGQYALNAVPPSVKEEIMGMIRAFVESNLEK